LQGMTVSDCLRTYETGGLRRKPDGMPFADVIESERTSRRERDIADHPSLKPQSFLRQMVYAALPLGKGMVVDPFMGSGSTIAACEAVGYKGIGLERVPAFYEMSQTAVPKLTELFTPEQQLSLALF
ncbi:MAG TPA: DNA methyltransferase, partial [Chloroflexota bacterium]|nr:DNA methyltransferase [Chloroflexota bacterium]